jgi:hypothetical protein
MEKNVDILEITKATRNVVNIKGIDGTIFAIARINTIITQLYSKLVEETTQASKDIFKLQELIKKVDKITKGEGDKKSIDELKSISEKIESMSEKVKGSNSRYIKKQNDLIKYILHKNDIEYSKKYWDEWTLEEKSAFIKECIEKDVDPKKKTG